MAKPKIKIAKKSSKKTPLAESESGIIHKISPPMHIEHPKNVEVTHDHVEKVPDKKPKMQVFDVDNIKPEDGKPLRKRVETGIDGLDQLIDGGIPQSSSVLLTGVSGTGKTIFGMQFLIEGAKKGEPGVYISLEESIDRNIEQMKGFGWDVEKLIDEKKLLIITPELYKYDALLTTIEDSVNRIKAKRLVIDSISIIGMFLKDIYTVRRSLLRLEKLLKKLGCTTIAIDEIREGEKGLSAFGVEEFVVDGVIVLYYVQKGNMFVRAVAIRKMRGTDHSKKIHPMEITENGVLVYGEEEVFEEI